MSRIPSPHDDRRACLCPDGTYSRECCNGELMSQGIGNITKTSVTRYYTVTSCTHGSKHIHTHDINLTVGDIYYLTFVHNNHTGCYTITATRNQGHFEVSAATSYNDCAACLAAN